MMKARRINGGWSRGGVRDGTGTTVNVALILVTFVKRAFLDTLTVNAVEPAFRVRLTVTSVASRVQLAGGRGVDGQRRGDAQAFGQRAVT